MDKKQLEDIVESSATINFDKIQKQLDPVSSIFRESNKTLKNLEDLGPMKVLNQYQATQGLMEQYTKNFTLNDAYLNNDTIRTMRELLGSISHKILASEALKLNTSLQRTLETAHMASKPPTQFIFPKGWDSGSKVSESNSVMSKITKSIEQYNQFSKLESFKAISRLKNFPKDSVWQQGYSELPEITESSIVEAKKIDAEISDEISSVDDFNDLTENSQRSLEKLNLSYYQIFIIHYIYYITILRDQISNSLKYSNMEFRFVGLSSKVLVGVCFIGFQPDFNSICNSILATTLLESIKKNEEK